MIFCRLGLLVLMLRRQEVSETVLAKQIDRVPHRFGCAVACRASGLSGIFTRTLTG